MRWQGRRRADPGPSISCRLQGRRTVERAAEARASGLIGPSIAGQQRAGKTVQQGALFGGVLNCWGEEPMTNAPRKILVTSDVIIPACSFSRWISSQLPPRNPSAKACRRDPRALSPRNVCRMPRGEGPRPAGGRVGPDVAGQTPGGDGHVAQCPPRRPLSRLWGGVGSLRFDSVPERFHGRRPGRRAWGLRRRGEEERRRGGEKGRR